MAGKVKVAGKEKASRKFLQLFPHWLLYGDIELTVGVLKLLLYVMSSKFNMNYFISDLYRPVSTG